MTQTPIEIEDLLASYVPREEAALRAHQVYEDMVRIGFELELSNENPRGLWTHLGRVPQAEYLLPKTAFDINSDKDDNAMSGSFATCGNLLRLSQCVKFGRRFIPHLWPDEFGPRLFQEEHLDALNEIWWLKFWHGIESVERGPKKNKASPDFEWLIRLRDGLALCQINLEVKRRPGNLNQNFKHGKPKASLGGIAKKFGLVDANTANIVALTVFVPITEEAWRNVLAWLDQQPYVHGVLIWTEGNLSAIPLRKHFKAEKRWAELLVMEAEPEDLKVAGRTAGTLCKASEAFDFIKKLAEEQSESGFYY